MFRANGVIWLFQKNSLVWTRNYSTGGIQKIGVVGAGQMGMGIAQVAAQIAKRTVLLYDLKPEAIRRGIDGMSKLLAKNVEKGKLTGAEKEAIERAIVPADLTMLAQESDFIIEAATENTELKLKIFEQLDKAARPGIVLATNTSSISITKIGSATKRPAAVIGMHFMNPVPVMQLVEIIPGLATSPETLDITVTLAEEMGKTTTQSRDIPGFIANRILMPYINEAFYALFEGIGSPADIDTTMKLGTNVPMGPLTLADFIGLDTCQAILQVLHSQLGDPKYRPCPLLVKYVEAGWVGKKSGRGVYDYTKK